MGYSAIRERSTLSSREVGRLSRSVKWPGIHSSGGRKFNTIQTHHIVVVIFARWSMALFYLRNVYIWLRLGLCASKQLWHSVERSAMVPWLFSFELTSCNESLLSLTLHFLCDLRVTNTKGLNLWAQLTVCCNRKILRKIKPEKNWHSLQHSLGDSGRVRDFWVP